jgi:hypothetical protein
MEARWSNPRPAISKSTLAVVFAILAAMALLIGGVHFATRTAATAAPAAAQSASGDYSVSFTGSSLGSRSGGNQSVEGQAATTSGAMTARQPSAERGGPQLVP